jgi:hypothetical protein
MDRARLARGDGRVGLSPIKQIIWREEHDAGAHRVREPA